MLERKLEAKKKRGKANSDVREYYSMASNECWSYSIDPLWIWVAKEVRNLHNEWWSFNQKKGSLLVRNPVLSQPFPVAKLSPALKFQFHFFISLFFFLGGENKIRPVNVPN